MEIALYNDFSKAHYTLSSTEHEFEAVLQKSQSSSRSRSSYRVPKIP